MDDELVETIETIIFKPENISNALSSQSEIVLKLISDDNPELTAIEYEKESFAEHESISITASISEPHSKDISIPINLSGTGTLNLDYEVEFNSKEETCIVWRSFRILWF